VIFSRSKLLAAQPLLLLCAGWLGAQTAPPPPGTGKLVRIVVTGSQRYAQEAIAAAAGLALGQEVTRDALQAAADRLSSLGLFQNVRFSFRSQQDKVEASYQVDDAPLVPAYYDNFPWFTDEELAAAIKAEAPLFAGLLPQGGAVLDAAVSALQKLLPSRNVAGTVERELVGEIYGDGLMMRFRIAGPSLKVSDVQFQDALAAADQGLRVQAQELRGKSYSRFALEVFINEHVRPLYDARGHLRARYGPPQARFTGDPTKPLADHVLVLVPIDPGPVYRWGGVTWSGNAAFGPAALDGLVMLLKGDPVNGNAVHKLWQTIETEYARRGYVEARVQALPRFDEAQKRVHYHAQIDEGSIYRMGDLIITGLSELARRRLREKWALEKGTIFNHSYFREFLASCRSKQVFGDYVVHFEDVGYLLQPKPDKTIDVMLDFK
jgi:outer membrane protein assembly factor BamA